MLCESNKPVDRKNDLTQKFVSREARQGEVFMKKNVAVILWVLLSFLMVIYMVPLEVYAYGAEALREALSPTETDKETLFRRNPMRRMT